jgi:hypothetical protein
MDVSNTDEEEEADQDGWMRRRRRIKMDVSNNAEPPVQRLRARGRHH